MSPRTRLRLVLLGARLSLGAGRESWARTVLTAAGVAAGVALLLGAAALPRVVDAREARDAARTDFRTGDPLPRAADTLLSADATAPIGDEPVYARLLEPEGPDAPVPPGVRRLPRPGEAFVSPALAERLRSGPDAAQLRRRLGARVVGTIDRAGLMGPGELAFYRGARGLDPGRDGVTRLDRFGEQGGRHGLPPILVLLLALAVVALVTPVAVFIATAVRFGGESRDRRLAALRLVGADRTMVAHVAAGEALVGALGGLAAGAALFAALRPVAGRIRVAELSVYAADVRPSWALALLVAVTVPLAAVVVTLLAMRRVAAEPLGVVRRATPARRRLAWRLVLPAIGAVLLLTMAGIREVRAAIGVALVLVGVAGLLPWIVERVVARLGGGPVPWQLAVRRLQVSGGTAARVVTGVAVAVAGAVALQMLLTAAERDQTFGTGAGDDRFGAIVEGKGDLDARIARADGVATAVTLRTTAEDEVFVATCPDLRELAALPRCADGDAFVAPSPSPQVAGPPKPGTRVAGWTVPAGLPRVAPRRDWSIRRLGRGAVLATPGAVPARLRRQALTTSYVALRAGADIEDVRTAAAVADPLARTFPVVDEVESVDLVIVRRAITIGALLVLVLIAASLLVDAAEQLRERRRLLAELRAFGVRRGTIAWSLLWQAGIPVALGLGLATLVGVALGAVMLRIADEPVRVDPGAILALAGAGAAAVLVVTLASLPPLWRAMGAAGLRTE